MNGSAAEQGLRVAVRGGGCSGFQYNFSFEDQRNDDDLVIERNGETDVAAQVQEELRLPVALGGVGDRTRRQVRLGVRRRGDGLLDAVREALDLAHDPLHRLGLHRAPQLGEFEREQVHHRDLADERLRRRDADLHPGARVEHAVGVARCL